MLAAATITLATTGNNAFALNGAGLTGIAVLDLQIGYDASTLTNPRIEKGGLVPADAIFDFNPSGAGDMRLFIRIRSQAIAGAGSIATLRFDGTDGSIGKILSLSANLVTVMATPAAAQVQIVNPAPPAPPQPDPVTTDTTAGSGLGYRFRRCREWAGRLCCDFSAGDLGHSSGNLPGQSHRGGAGRRRPGRKESRP